MFQILSVTQFEKQSLLQLLKDLATVETNNDLDNQLNLL